ncbi:MAG: 23S rRNA (guanosine(2251)-2'-O)-methyltransferase RlmB [Flavobacteriaceae bacterium]|nr:23S rRNA (guanosine(2251)-2'-O)-methyltransferase RlmB [Flavobacteriaceae bacterium]
MNKESKIFGIYPVLEAIKSDTVIDKLFVQKGISNPKIDQIVKQLEQEHVTISEVPIEKLDKLTRSNHQGVVAITSPISFHTLEEVVEKALAKESAPLFIILDQISDVRNFGAILRTAECTGVDAVIIQKKGGAPVSGDTVKTSAGAIFKMPICKVDHIKDAMFYLQGSGIKVVAASEKASQSVYEVDFKQAVAIVMGSEGKGVSKSVQQLADESAGLPLKGEINSLNVSVACGAFLYETVRQRSL